MNYVILVGVISFIVISICIIVYFIYKQKSNSKINPLDNKITTKTIKINGGNNGGTSGGNNGGTSGGNNGGTSGGNNGGTSGGNNNGNNGGNNGGSRAETTEEQAEETMEEQAEEAAKVIVINCWIVLK